MVKKSTLYSRLIWKSYIVWKLQFNYFYGIFSASLTIWHTHTQSQKKMYGCQIFPARYTHPNEIKWQTLLEFVPLFRVNKLKLYKFLPFSTQTQTNVNFPMYVINFSYVNKDFPSHVFIHVIVKLSLHQAALTIFRWSFFFLGQRQKLLRETMLDSCTYGFFWKYRKRANK